jgi:hypothetical protein
MRFFRRIRYTIEGAFRSIQNYPKFAAELKSEFERIGHVATATDRNTLFFSIGVALTTWAKMEEGLVMMARILLGISSPQAGVILYSVINFNAWIGIIDDLFPLNPEQMNLKPRWNQISKNCAK